MRYSTDGSISAVSLPISARRDAHGAGEFLAHVAVIAESALQGDRGDGLVGLDQELADFADAKLAKVGRGCELKGFLEVSLKTPDGHAS